MGNIGASFRNAALLLLTLLMRESPAIYVRESDYEGVDAPDFVDFYIYNNTSIPLAIAAGSKPDFSPISMPDKNFWKLPKTVAPHSVGAAMKLDAQDKWKSDGTFVASLTKDGETSSFAVWGSSRSTIGNEHQTKWTLYTVSGGWNTTDHAVCECGAENLLDPDGYVNQIWGLRYLVTLFIVFPTDDKSIPKSMIDRQRLFLSSMRKVERSISPTGADSQNALVAGLDIQESVEWSKVGGFFLPSIQAALVNEPVSVA